ncbi:alpha/beta fold hydrolase [Shewanella seohaensis]|uniref:alpha/beta fold hydrolase n=1 Tax=Shewanella seohaensis TaxID=755175 RepID=UPI0035BADAF4
MDKIGNELQQAKVFKTFSDTGEGAHFYHANGFPLGVYAPLLAKLQPAFSLSALELRPTWPDVGLPPKRRDWQLYADDLISHIERHCSAPIVGIGHSMGATSTILAASKRPDLFKALVLIEPAMVSRSIAWFAKLMPKSLMNFTAPAKNTLKKRDMWESREHFLEYCKMSKLYKRFDDEAFAALAQFGVYQNTDGQFTLKFPKQWEAHNYTQPPNVLSILQQLKLPCVAIRGKPSVFFSEATWQRWQQLAPDTVFLEDKRYGHLLPLEDPSACVSLIQSGLAELHRNGRYKLV